MRTKFGRIATVLVVAMSFQTVPASRAQASPTESPQFESDLSQGDQRGIGARFVHKSSGAYVDLRLLGFPGANARRKGAEYEYRASSSVTVIYKPTKNRLKDYVLLNTRSIDTLRYKLSAPDLEPTIHANQEITFSNERHPALFTIAPIRAWDASGRDIPSTLSLDNDRIVVALDKKALRSADLPVTVDPIISGAPAGSTSRQDVRRLFQAADSRLVFFSSEPTVTGGRVVYRTSSDSGITWSDANVVTTTVTTPQFAVAQASDDTFQIVYTNGPEGNGYVAYRGMQPSGSAWAVGSEKIVAPVGTAISPLPAVLDRGGTGSSNRRAMVGLRRYNASIADWEYVTYDFGQQRRLLDAPRSVWGRERSHDCNSGQSTPLLCSMGGRSRTRLARIQRDLLGKRHTNAKR